MFVIFSFYNCNPIVDFEMPEFKAQPVIRCLFHENSQFKVYIQKTTEVLDADSLGALINDAIVILSDNDNNIDTLPLIQQGLYSKENLFPALNKEYTLKVIIPEFGEFIACDYLPQKNNIQYVIHIQRVKRQNEVSFYDKIRVEISDEANQNNYYDILFRERDNEYGRSILYNLKSDHPSIKDEGLEVYYPFDLIFTDRLFDGTKTIMDIYVREINGDINNWLICISGSENYYKFQRSAIIHTATNNFDFFFPVEPINLYTNFKGALGIFAGYQIDTLAIDIGIGNPEIKY